MKIESQELLTNMRVLAVLIKIKNEIRDKKHGKQIKDIFYSDEMTKTYNPINLNFKKKRKKFYFFFNRIY